MNTWNVRKHRASRRAHRYTLVWTREDGPNQYCPSAALYMPNCRYTGISIHSVNYTGDETTHKERKATGAKVVAMFNGGSNV